MRSSDSDLYTLISMGVGGGAGRLLWIYMNKVMPAQATSGGGLYRKGMLLPED